MQSSGNFRTALAALAFSSAACTEAPEPVRPVSLSDESLSPPPAVAPRAWGESASGPMAIRQDASGTGSWVTTVIRDELWTAAEGAPGVWLAPRAFHGWGEPPDGAPPARLVAGQTEYSHHTWKEVWGALKSGAPTDLGGRRAFCIFKDRVVVAQGASLPAPRNVRLAEYAGHAFREDGRYRARLGRFTADGFALPTGGRHRVSLPARDDGTRGGRLSFLLCAFDPLGRQPAPRLRLTVLADGRPLFDEELASARDPRTVPRAVDLADASELELRVEGETGFVGFLAPRVDPAGVPRVPDARPNLLLFLADTFRADNLALHGGPPGLTPNLDGLAEQSLRFERAFAPSSWTLPSHASLFTGLHPMQHGASRSGSRLPEEATTLAECLRAAGYRTVAVTESGYLEPAYGLAQGFEVYDCAREDLDASLERLRSLLEVEDDRPLFLFFQTYRAHLPYEAAAELVATWSEPSGAACEEPDWAEVPKRIEPGGGDELAELQRCVRALYRAGAHELDAGFGRFLRLVDERGLRENGALAFTSDHGEGLWEHGVWEHGNGVWNEHLHVPLILNAPGLAPRLDTAPATLLDLGRTFLELAGVPAPPGWRGQDLRDAGRPALAGFSFECNLAGEPSRCAVYADRYKALLPVEGLEDGLEGLLESDAVEIYDLEKDPHERAKIAPPSPDVSRLFLEERGALLDALRPILPQSERRHLPERELEALRELGYAGD